MDISQQYRVSPTASQRRGSGLTLLIGVLAVLAGLAFLFKLTGMFRLPFQSMIKSFSM